MLESKQIDYTPINPERIVREYTQTEEATAGWKYADHARMLYSYQRIIAAVLFPLRDETQKPMPDVLVAVDRLPVNILGSFHLVPDGLGLRHKITMNALYADRPMWEQLETLVHENVHVFINAVLGHKDTHKYHSAEFVQLMADLGLKVKPVEGYHLAPASGQFERLMSWLDVPKPTVRGLEDNGGVLPPGWKFWWDGDRGRSRGGSTLTKYVAEGCIRSPSCSLRAGKKDLLLKCARAGCAGVFHPETGS